MTCEYKSEWMGRTRWRRAFTLIELLVVVAILALLISILLPSLNGARKQARVVKCGANLRQVGQAMQTYLAESRATFPPAYYYAVDADGGFDPFNQPVSREFGYVHWSFFLYARGQAGDSAFQCPEFARGGTPRTNPGPTAAYWEPRQRDDTGSTGPSPTSREDKQAPRIAFTGNAAIFPRNKFTLQLAQATSAGAQRYNRFVNETEIKRPGQTILATELNTNWIVSAEGSDGDPALLSKSHRPINPFFALGTGSDEYGIPENNNLALTYMGSDPGLPYGLLPEKLVNETPNLIGNPSYAETNAVGRHHPGGDKLGGSVNFLYVDGHVERKTILKTLQDREWGDKYYSLTGATEVRDRFGQINPY